MLSPFPKKLRVSRRFDGLNVDLVGFWSYRRRTSVSAGIRETYDPLREMTRRFHVSKDSRATQTNNDGATRRAVAALGPTRTCIDIHHRCWTFATFSPMYSARCEIEFVHCRVPPDSCLGYFISPRVYTPTEAWKGCGQRVEIEIFDKSLANVVRNAVISLLMERTNY